MTPDEMSDKMLVNLGWDPSGVPLILDMRHPEAQHLALVGVPELAPHVTGAMHRARECKFVLVHNLDGLNTLHARLPLTSEEVAVVFHDCDDLLQGSVASEILATLLEQGGDAHVHVVVSVSDAAVLPACAAAVPRVVRSELGRGYTLLVQGNTLDFDRQPPPKPQPQPEAWNMARVEQEQEWVRKISAAKQSRSRQPAWLFRALRTVAVLLAIVVAVQVQQLTQDSPVLVGVTTGLLGALALTPLLLAVFKRP